jgi:hypothetical protein
MHRCKRSIQVARSALRVTRGPAERDGATKSWPWSQRWITHHILVSTSRGVVTSTTFSTFLLRTVATVADRYCSTTEPIMGFDGLQDIKTESECGGSMTVRSMLNYV